LNDSCSSPTPFILLFENSPFINTTWEEDEQTKIDHHLTDTAISIILAGEIRYRNFEHRLYNCHIEYIEELKEDERQRILAEEQAARELKEKQERARINRLLLEARYLQKAEFMRMYVESVLSTHQTQSTGDDSIENWPNWALQQADRIDPINTSAYLSY